MSDEIGCQAWDVGHHGKAEDFIAVVSLAEEDKMVWRCPEGRPTAMSDGRAERNKDLVKARERGLTICVKGSDRFTISGAHWIGIDRSTSGNIRWREVCTIASGVKCATVAG